MAPTFTVLFLVFFSWTAVMAEKNTKVDKRLLLDDPLTVSSQMLSLQREIQTLQTKIAEIDVHQSQIQFLNAQVSHLQHENDALKLQISQGSSNPEIQTLTSKVATLEALHLDQKLSVVTSKVATFESLDLDNELLPLKTMLKENQHILQHTGTDICRCTVCIHV